MQNIYYHIDLVNVTKNNIIIRGWAFSTTQKQITISIKENNKYQIQKMSREDVKNAFQEYEQAKCSGFKLIIDNTENLNEITLIFKDNHQEIIYNININEIRVKNTKDQAEKEVVEVVKSNSIKYNIDEYKIEKNQLIIKGWAFSNSESKQLKISILDNIEYQTEKVDRIDVFNNFNKNQCLKSGFIIRVHTNNKRNINLVLKLEKTKEKVSLTFNVKQIKKYTRVQKIQRVKSLLNNTNLKKFILYIKKNGIKKAIIKAKDKFNGNIKNDFSELYNNWIKENESYDVNKINAELENFRHSPKISIIMPVYNVEEKWLRKCIESVQNQYYRNWELCIADDKSTYDYIRPLLEGYMLKDNRIKVVFREVNGHISKASNSALELADGEYIALLDNDDELPPFALYEVVKLINEKPDADLIYSDEDKIDEKGNRIDPHFKPDWSPDTLLSSNYISHLGVYRTSIIKKIGGFRVGYEGSQDYDLILRFTEKTNNIYHISKVLYHWRMVEGSTALGGENKGYAYKAGLKALEDAIFRRKYDARVVEAKDVPYYNVIFNYYKEDFVSIIIPTRDRADILETCLESIYTKSIFKNYEIIIVDNGSIEEETFRLFSKYKEDYANFRVIKVDIPFNYSKLNNEGVKVAKGNLLLFLNNDIEVISKDWLDKMVGQARRSEIGVVGSKLYYPNNRIQHAGVVLGMGGIAGHAHLMADKYEFGYYARLKVNYNYSAVTGACMMIKRTVFEQVGGFEENLAVAFNDIDLCIRIMNEGYYNIHLADVELYHHESISRGKEDSEDKLRRFNLEIKYMTDKWKDVLENDLYYNKNLSLNDNNFAIKS